MGTCSFKRTAEGGGEERKWSWNETPPPAVLASKGRARVGAEWHRHQRPAHSGESQGPQPKGCFEGCNASGRGMWEELKTKPGKSCEGRTDLCPDVSRRTFLGWERPERNPSQLFQWKPGLERAQVGQRAPGAMQERGRISFQDVDISSGEEPPPGSGTSVSFGNTALKRRLRAQS